MQFKYIITNPKILGGKPIVQGTRMSEEFILELVAPGGLLLDIVKNYPHLKEEAVREAILFAAISSKINNHVIGNRQSNCINF